MTRAFDIRCLSDTLPHVRGNPGRETVR